MAAVNEKPVRDVSIHRLYRESGGRSWMREYLSLLTSDIVEWKDDFLGDTLHGGYGVTTGVDGALAISAGTLNGEAVLDASSGAGADNEYGGAYLGLQWKGDNFAAMEVRLKIDDVATVKVECGFTDAVGDAGAVNVLATPTYTATDLALWIVDTDDTANWQGVGAKAGTGITKLEPSIGPAAATYQTLGVALYNDVAYYWIKNADGEVIYESGPQENAIEGGTLVTPWIFVQLRAGTIDRNVTIDYIRVWQRRA